MMTREDYIEETRKVFNHIGLLYDCEIVRCVGFAEDEDDFYWVCISTKGQRRYASMVGAFISLKDLNYPRYEYLDKLMTEYWGAPKEEQFEIEWIGMVKGNDDTEVFTANPPK